MLCQQSAQFLFHLQHSSSLYRILEIFLNAVTQPASEVDSTSIFFISLSVRWANEKLPVESDGKVQWSKGPVVLYCIKMICMGN